jgi:hypothetical protein
MVRRGLVIKVDELTSSWVVGRRDLVIHNTTKKGRNFFTEPFPSSETGIYLSKGLSKHFATWPIVDFCTITKCIVSPFEKDFVTYPLLDTTEFVILLHHRVIFHQYLKIHQGSIKIPSLICRLNVKGDESVIYHLFLNREVSLSVV